jgi:hypothetical protein
MIRPLAALVLGLVLVTTASPQRPTLLLFGGRDHDKFLGCLNCSRYDAASIWNPYGQHGSIYNTDSIWNRYGTWGSPYSSNSPWNRYSSSAPVIVDRDGRFYGHFSSNQHHPKRTTIEWVVWVLDRYEWVIEHLDEVRDRIN